MEWRDDIEILTYSAQKEVWSMRQFGLNQGGFTLLEVLVALTIFSVGLLGIAGLQIHSQNFNTNSTVRTQTASLAEMAMEELLSLSADNAIFTSAQPVVGAFDLKQDDPNTLSLFLQGGGTYNATYRITPNSPTAGLATVAVTVQAPNNRTLTLTSYKRVAL